jgi:hypothetical protein
MRILQQLGALPFKRLRRDSSDLLLVMDDFLVKGDRAEFHWTFVGTDTGPGGTGKPVRFSGFEEWKIGDDGLIAESLGHFDSADY